MKLFLEFWKPNERWREMAVDDRQAFIESLGPGMNGLLEAGVELVGIGTIDPGTDQRADYDYWAVWRIPTDELVERFESTVRGDGFYDHFEQINARGEPASPAEVFEAMVRA